ncbi:MAG: DUF2855 family protein [Alphaproteobacteria bacterium]|nr:MAG: DUF2855 family protein [Alphaproteobacteria bacterium]
MSGTTDIWVVKKDLRTFKVVEAEDLMAKDLADGQLVMKVDRFAMTSNNITYAAFGDVMQYWDFFPAEGEWGRVPVWGFGDVVRSECPDVAVGERFYGYFPMSTHLLLQPGKVTEYGFMDNSPHRRELVATYNNYTRTSADPSYDPAHESEQMVIRPLFATSFILDDFVADNDFFGATSVILGSASSKTALGLAFLLHANHPDIEVVGLTSKTNMAFVEGLGCYDKVVAYGDIDSLDASTPSMMVDMSGNAKVISDVHHHFGDALKYNCLVGGTHWEDIKLDHGEMPGAKPIGFFAPDQFTKRAKDWGGAVLQQKMGEAWDKFLGPVSGWIHINYSFGPEAAAASYLKVLEGKVAPDQAHVISVNGAAG